VVQKCLQPLVNLRVICFFVEQKFYYRRVITEGVYGKIDMKEIKTSLQISNARLGYSDPGVKRKKG